MRHQSRISSIKPWWLRLIFLILCGLPILTGWPIKKIAKLVASFPPADSAIPVSASYTHLSLLMVWLAYGIIIWLLIFWTVGKNQFWNYMVVAVVIGLTTAVLGAIARKIAPFLAGGINSEEISFRMMMIFILCIVSVPFSLMCVNSFSAMGMVEGAARIRKAESKDPDLRIHFALALRMFQHAGEVVVTLFQIWKEENPQLLLPRNRRDFSSKWYSSMNFLPWVWEASIAWAFALMMITFAPLPLFICEFERVGRVQRGGENG